MSPLFVYLLKASATVFVLWVFYFLCLRRLTFHKLNRYFFITGMMVSFLWPALPLEDWFFKAPQISQVVYIPVSAFMFQFKPEKPTFGIEQFLTICYLGGVLFMLIRLGIQIFSLRNIFKRSERQVIQNVDVRVVKEKINPFSFFGQIFLNPANHSATELTAIIEHEKVHNHRVHSIDIILSELVKIALWFNPFSWLFCKVVKENIEFEVDRILLHQGIDCKAYQYSLLKLSTIKNQNPITNHFNLSNLKIRIIMMNKKQSSRYGLANYALVIPILLFSMVISVAFAQNKLPGKKSNSKVTTIVLKDSLSEKHPLIKLDGVVIDKQDMDKISTDKIESINILRGVNATKAYGEKGRDGVILITSKKEITVEKPATSTGLNRPDSIKGKELLIIDGVISEKSGKEFLMSEDANQFESINSLKEDIATKLYGDKGKNGVMIILTKKNTLKTNSLFEGSSSSTNTLFKEKYILLDGVEIDEAKVKEIDTETILTMDVLKGKSATAIYGDKGKNGVILITTKKK
ncbi:MAG: hypothetical protein HXX14_17185 [Bacteroidetes bacterium]|nr:hypothetical protein [Bacteroidota bacterium]